MIKSIIIKKLFGRFDYTLEFLPERIMIITGPNGYGKSTILRMINSFCSDDFSVFLRYPFSKFIVYCELNTIEIKKNENGFTINQYTFPYPKPSKTSDKEENEMTSRDTYISFFINRTLNDIAQDYEKKAFIKNYYDDSTKGFITELIDNDFIEMFKILCDDGGRASSIDEIAANIRGTFGIHEFRQTRLYTTLYDYQSKKNLALVN